ncbi:MAG: hypothetical protein RIT25_583 [Planctomycetota bacterium]|jgi:hypothetical protein
MKQLLSPLCAAALLAASLSAQCYETNLGTQIGTGDDTLFAVQPLGFTFPMGGIAATYDAVQFNTNGVAFLTNGTTAAVGGTGTGYSTVAATQLNNLRGTAGQSPRIAALWRDLNMLAANSGAVFYNNAIPGKAVITWQNAVNYATTAPIFTVQMQLFASGDVIFYYSPTTQSSASTIVGVSEGNAVASVPGSNLNPGPNTATTRLIYEQFTANNVDLGGKALTFTTAGTGYVQTAANCGASNVNYGTGCGSQFSSFYELFGTSAAASATLSNTTLTMIPGGSNYLLAFAAGNTIVPPTAAATALTLGDDAQVAVTLSTAFPYPGGTTTSLQVCSNGFISLPPGNGVPYQPTGAAFMGFTQNCWSAFHDFYPNDPIGTSGQVKFEEAGGIAYITWDNVESYPGGVANPSTVQFQFNLSTGQVNIAFGTIDAVGGSSFGDQWLVGYAPGSATIDPGSRSLATALPLLLPATDVPALALACAPNPVIGNTLTWTTSNIPATSSLSLLLVSLAQVNPGLPVPGTPDCLQLVNLATAQNYVQIGGPTATTSLVVPNNPSLSGLPIACQAIALDPSANLLGAITSNGVSSVIGTF